MITLTLRKARPDRLELRYTPTNKQETLKTANLDVLRGHWVTAVEIIKFGQESSYSIEIKNIATGNVVFESADNAIDTWQDGAAFAKRKWGIYRSLHNKQDLQDEIVNFADFSIEEITGSLSIYDLKKKADKIVLVPNLSTLEVTFENAPAENYDVVELYDISGRKISIKKRLKENKLNVSELPGGMYFIVFKKDTITTQVLKCIVK
ncbi:MULTISPECIES: T9SS type A sorting domain-containing protein [unclassified Polaribacter]|uniref:T9SS type A sorting domain-containing protein n=1 Tax=unclassified Polaribacter TaxID=196858 RepID=UPI001CB8B074|nr:MULTISPECIES: T9SS type A sorting domain-containing protein [unclassified Polaribacter]